MDTGPPLCQTAGAPSLRADVNDGTLRCVTLSCPAMSCCPQEVPHVATNRKVNSDSMHYQLSYSSYVTYVGSGRGAGSKRQEDTLVLALRWMKGIELAA